MSIANVYLMSRVTFKCQQQMYILWVESPLCNQRTRKNKYTSTYILSHNLKEMFTMYIVPAINIPMTNQKTESQHTFILSFDHICLVAAKIG